MRDWILKWQKTIILVIAVVFIGSIIWWTVASYMTPSTSGSQQTQGEYIPNRSEAMAVVTKDGTDLSYNYWVMAPEVNERVQQMTSLYSQYGMSIDELFQQPYVELNSVKALIDDKIVLYYADQNSIDPTEEEINNEINSAVDPQLSNESVVQAIEYRYGSVENYKKTLVDPVTNQLKISMVKDKVAVVNNDDLKVYYTENEEKIKEDGEQVKAAHILVESEDKANEILADIKAERITFSVAASENSTDKSNSSNGGELGWFGRNKMEKPFEEAAFNAEVGELVGPVQTAYGYHIIKVEDKKSINSFDDYLVSDAIESAKTTLQNDKYNEWFENYKEENNFSYVLNDDVENAYDRYNKETEGAENKIAKVSEFKKWLEGFILVESDGKISVDTNVDPRIVSLYVSVLEELKSDLEKENDTLKDFEKVAALVSDELKSKTLTDVEDEIKSVEDKIASSESDEEKTTLNEEKASLNNAKDYLEKLADIEKLNLKSADVAGKITSNEKTIEEYKERDIEALRILYDMNTSSKNVVQMLHNYLPNDLEVSLKWYQIQIDGLMPYLNNDNLFTQYKSMLDPQLMQIQLGLLSIIKDENASFDLKVSTYELLINLLESWKQYAEEIKYLKELKELNPEYPDIDSIIKQVEDQFAEYQKSLEAEASSTTVE